MRIRSPRRPLFSVLLALGLLAGPTVLAAAPAAGLPTAPLPGAAGSATERQSVLLELDTESAAPAWRRAAETARRDRSTPERARQAAAAAGRAARSRADRALERLAHAVDPDVLVLYRTRTLFTGLAVNAPTARLAALRRLPGVRAVHPITLKQRANAHSVPLTGAPAVWAGPPGGTGSTGAGVRIGIIDSGIDYTHADFGGPGTEAAYRSVDPAKPAPAGLFPNAKVTGGADLVGDDYDPDPAAPGHQPVPHPDANPLDCARNGHGTHVAGTVAGYGVDAQGRTYHGPYRPGLDPAAFRVGPGAAPGATLYAIKVFGCQGSTDQLAHALDLAADPNQDGDLADHLDVVNLSLGSGFGDPGDADALAADKLAEAGTIVVASAGNDGDVYGVGGSPGVAARAIAVAASVGGHGDADGLRVLAPPALAGLLPSHWSARYQGWSSAEVRASLGRPAADLDGCAPFAPADAARLRGKVALLDWTVADADRACGSTPRADHAAEAGAVGVLLAADGDHLGEISGDERIPEAILARADGDTLRQAAAAGEVTVELAAPGNPLHGAVAQDQPERVDTVARFSSRGLGQAGVVKPDLAAPGETIWSAKAGSGSQGTRDDGTSMAAPHVAGIAALVRAVHPDWSVTEVKAALMNTATDVRSAPGQAGVVLGPERAGAGRVRADLAVATPAVAYAAEDAGQVGLSFGPLPVTGPLAATREVVVRNLSGAPLAYRTGYQAATELPGARFELTPDRLTVAPGQSARVQVTLRAAGPLDRTPDPSIALTQGGRARSYRGELSGQLLLTPEAAAGSPVLRVPLLAAPRPASELTATAVGGSGSGPVRLAVTGTPARSGAGIASLVSAFELGGEGERRPDCPPGGHSSDTRAPDGRAGRGTDASCAARPLDRAADLRAVGAASDAPTTGAADATLYLAATSWAPAAAPVAAVAVRAALDTDGDGVPDALVLADRLPGSDVLVARLLDARTGRQLDVQPLNARWGETDTDLLDSDTVVLPIRLAALPRFPAAGGRIRYAVWTGQVGAAPDPAHALSAIGLSAGHPALEIDPLHPALDIRVGPAGPSAIVQPEFPGTLLEVRRSAPGPARLLLVHHLNPDGRRAQLLTLPAG
ncbi:subtilisin family serine protease [Kitasatospora sp. GAS204A]|uniref:S8 family peptidase n=1 Tax=unclassified Kitasatospora TaxID=2633591 RepID=UPI002473A558|nr:S8 family serine peptidase [Kitasatospora sp. GAS204B]MDH6116244.1 subtilisin family serine protease [Kitasatospora sp. GAS204B]